MYSYKDFLIMNDIATQLKPKYFPSISPKSIVLIGSLLALLFVSVQILFFYRGIYSSFDDAFITFRYSRNLAQGLGPVYNPGEAVEGYTNFLWMLSLAIGNWLGLEIISFSYLLGILSAFAVLHLTYRLGLIMGFSGWMSLFPVLLLSLNASFARYSVSGMETLFFTALLVASYVTLLSNPMSKSNIFVSSLFLVLTSLTRPEGLLFLIILFIFHYYFIIKHIGKSRLVEAGVSLPLILFLWLLPWVVFFLPYLVWKIWFYGDLLPNTFYVKVGLSNTATIARGLQYLIMMLIVVNLSIFLPQLFLPFLNWTSTKKIIAISVTAYLAYVVYIGGDHYFGFGPRFITPIYPFLIVLGFAALKDFRDRFSFGWGRLISFNSYVLVFLIVIILGQAERFGYIETINLTTRGWVQAGKWLENHASPHAVIAADAAGIIPYLTDLHTIDMYGLNDRYIARSSITGKTNGLVGHEKYAPNYVLDRQPDYILSWVNRDGDPTTAGLPEVKFRFNSEYSLHAIFLMREPLIDDMVVIETNLFHSDYYEKGYRYAIFRKN
jgi:arabinofuranosyltransferase